MGYLCANFSLPRPLCSRLRPHVRDRQRDVRRPTDVRRASSLNARYPRRGSIINLTQSVDTTCEWLNFADMTCFGSNSIVKCTTFDVYKDCGICHSIVSKNVTLPLTDTFLQCDIVVTSVRLFFFLIISRVLIRKTNVTIRIPQSNHSSTSAAIQDGRPAAGPEVRLSPIDPHDQDGEERK